MATNPTPATSYMPLEAVQRREPEPDDDDQVSPDDQDKVELQKTWLKEIGAAKKETEAFRKAGRSIVERYLEMQQREQGQSTRSYFTANVQTKEAIFYGKTPKVDVERKWSDPNDDAARVASTMLERILNGDIHRADDEYSAAMGMALNDVMMPGLGFARVHYRPKTEKVEATPAIPGEPDPVTGEPTEKAPAVPEYEKVVKHEVETEYVYWEDVLWSAGVRHWGATRWVAFRVYMTRKELVKRFGDVGKTLSLNAKKASSEEGKAADLFEPGDPRDRAEIWEIHSKETREFIWLHEQSKTILDVKKDELELRGFWRFGRPMMANLTSTAMVPRADFTLTEDVYRELDLVSTRINKLQRAIRVRGIYDQKEKALAKILQEASDNDMIPVEAWAALKERGGLSGAAEFLPVDVWAKALEIMLEVKAGLKQELFELTGMSDLVRGEGDPSETATAQGIKAKFASVRLKKQQDEFARFCSEHQRIRAEILCKCSEPEQLVKESNIERSGESPENITAAVQLLKESFDELRIEVKPESVSLEDFAQTRNEASELLTAIATMMQSFAPLMQNPMTSGIAGQLVAGLIQWLISQVKAGKKLEGLVDQAIATAKQQQEAAAAQPQQPPPPDAKVISAQIKAKGDITKVQMEHASAMQQIQAQSGADLEHQKAQTAGNIMQIQARERAKVDQQIDQVINPPGSSG
jgi:hypothetical protein